MNGRGTAAVGEAHVLAGGGGKGFELGVARRNGRPWRLVLLIGAILIVKVVIFNLPGPQNTPGNWSICRGRPWVHLRVLAAVVRVLFR
jgi:hypothetical protein